MKNITIVSIAIIVYLLNLSTSSFAMSNKNIGSIFYQDEAASSKVLIGKISIEDSKLKLNRNLDLMNEKYIPIKNNIVDVKDFIKNHKKEQKKTMILINSITNSIQKEIDRINDLDGIYPDLHSLYLDLKTEETFQIKQKAVIIRIDNTDFTRELALLLYGKFKILLIPDIESVCKNK